MPSEMYSVQIQMLVCVWFTHFHCLLLIATSPFFLFTSHAYSSTIPCVSSQCLQMSWHFLYQIFTLPSLSSLIFITRFLNTLSNKYGVEILKLLSATYRINIRGEKESKKYDRSLRLRFKGHPFLNGA